MDQDVFSGGTAPGSPGTENEIKTLLCYLLSKAAQPLSFQQLHGAVGEHNLINYFELVAALDNLLATKHIGKEEGPLVDLYTVTPLGRGVADTLDTSLPFTVRQKAVAAADLMVQRHKRHEEVTTQLEPLDTGGYRLTLAIPEGETNLISFSVFAPTLEEGKRIQRGFLNDPVFIYQSVLALLRGDYQVLGELKPITQPLF